MDDARFDRLTRSVSATTRRTALGGLVLGLLGAAGLGVDVAEIDAQRRRNRNRNRGGRRNCGQQYAGCNDGRDCCTGLICKELRNPSVEAEFSGTCAYRGGCGKNNDFCKKNRDCCRQFRCQGRKCRRRNN